MKKYFAILLSLFVLHNVVIGQAKKPTIIVLPAMDWCKANGFVKTEMIFDEPKTMPDYDRALLDKPLLNDVLAVISEDMRNASFPPVILRNELKNLERRRAQDQIRRSKTGGGIAKSSIQLLREVAKADIEFHIYWEIEENGPRYRIKSYRLEGIDAYTSKPCGLAQGYGDWAYKNDVTESQLLIDAIAASMDGFRAKLQMHFDDLFLNGREIVLRIQTMDNWTKDLSTRDFGPKREQLSVIIENWVRSNTVKGRFDSPLTTDYSIEFTGVRIPLYSIEGWAMDGKMFATNLQNYLISIGINEKEIAVTNYGLGEVELIFGPN